MTEVQHWQNRQAAETKSTPVGMSDDEWREQAANGKADPAWIATLVRKLAKSDGRIGVTDLELLIWTDQLQRRQCADIMRAVRNWYAETRPQALTPADLRRFTMSVEERRAALMSAKMLRPPVRVAGSPDWFRRWRDAGSPADLIEQYRSGTL